MVAGAPQSKKDESIVAWLAKQHASYLMNTMVGLRELSGVVDGFSYSGPAGTRGFGELSDLMQQIGQRKADKGLERAAVQSAGILFHLPALQVQRLIDGFLSWQSGKTNAVSILFGKPPKK